MTATRIVGIILLVLGLAGLVTGGFSFTRETTEARIGPFQLQVQEKETVNIPLWLSVGAMLAGGVLLAIGLRRKG